MRESNTPRVYIFSAERAELSPDTNEIRTGEMRQALDRAGVPYRLGEGVYNGIEETSFVVFGPEDEDLVYNLASDFAQDYVLVVAENDRTAYLADPLDGELTHLGVFEQVTAAEAKGVDHTVVGFSHYIVRPTSGPDLPEGF